MRRLMTIAVAGLVALGLLVPAASARDGDVIRTGACSATTTWKLKLKPEDPAALQLAFEVDENVTGHTWRVRIVHNGDLVFKGRRTTRDPSGSFTIRRIVADDPGRDVVRARVFNPATGEVCRGRAAIRG